MAITPEYPTNGRAAFVADHDPHTYWELQDNTNGGVNYGDDATGNDNLTGLVAGNFTTQPAFPPDSLVGGTYNGLNTPGTIPASGDMDLYLLTDIGCLVYISNNSFNAVGLASNGGTTYGQGLSIRSEVSGAAEGFIEVALHHNNGGGALQGDAIIGRIADANIPGWFCISGQFRSAGGTADWMSLRINATEYTGQRSYEVAVGTNNPVVGSGQALSPNASWARGAVATTDWPETLESIDLDLNDIQIANFWCDNPSKSNSAGVAGLGDTAHTDYYNTHIAYPIGSGEAAWAGWSGTVDARAVTPWSQTTLATTPSGIPIILGTATGAWSGWTATATADIDNYGTAQGVWGQLVATVTGTAFTTISATGTASWGSWTATGVGVVEVGATVQGVWSGWSATGTGTVTVESTAAGVWGGWAATAEATTDTPPVNAVATGAWGGWVAAATANVDNYGTATATWGSWTATAIGGVPAGLVNGTATGTWGTWVATATGIRSFVGTATGTWGTWSATVDATRLLVGTASSSWSGWTATALGVPIPIVLVTAEWGGWTATATGIPVLSGRATATWGGWLATLEGTATFGLEFRVASHPIDSMIIGGKEVVAAYRGGDRFY